MEWIWRDARVSRAAPERRPTEMGTVAGGKDPVDLQRQTECRSSKGNPPSLPRRRRRFPFKTMQYRNNCDNYSVLRCRSLLYVSRPESISHPSL